MDGGLLLQRGQRVRAVRARVHTMSDADEVVRAFSIAAGRVEAHLPDAEFERLRADPAGAGVVLDVPDLFVLPGFIDSHIHVLSYGEHLDSVDLAGCDSIAELQRRLRLRAAEGRFPWIRGFGWDQDAMAENRPPTRRELDEAVPDRPCLLWRACFHVAVCNSAALAAAGIDAAGPADPPGGAIVREAGTGEPTGLLQEWAAVELVQKKAPPPTAADRARWLETSLSRLARLGVTSVQSNDWDGAWAVYEGLRGRRSAEGAEPPLPVRVYLTPAFDELEALEASGARTGLGDEWLRYGRLKIFADGSLGARTAALEEPYADAEGGDACCCSRGMLLKPPEELKRAIARAHGAGWALETHAIGDRAAEVVVSAYEALPDPRAARPVLTHAQVLSRGQIGRMAAAGVLANVQPVFLATDHRWAEQRLGPARMETAYAWRTLLEAGVPCAGGSDAPVESPDPILGLHATINRMDAKGQPEGGWRPAERLSPQRALRLFTRDGAYAEFAEGYKGQLAPGYLADFVVLDRDPLLADSYPAARVLLTVVGGTVTYAAGQPEGEVSIVPGPSPT